MDEAAEALRGGDIAEALDLQSEAMEAIAHGNEENSKVVGRAIEDIELPKGTAIIAIVRPSGSRLPTPSR